jgi:hypothetical protein
MEPCMPPISTKDPIPRNQNEPLMVLENLE